MSYRRLGYFFGHGTVLVLLAFWLVGSAASGQCAQAMCITSLFEIPAQPLSSALAQYAEQSGVHVTTSAALIEGKRSTGVMGKLCSARALKMILEGTTLSFETVADNFVVIVPVGATRDAPSIEKRPVSFGRPGTRHLGSEMPNGVSCTAYRETV